MRESLRIHEIDLLRFIAAMSVVIFHFSFRGAAADGFTTVSYPIWDVVSRYGYLGVNLFFMISGFVILLSTENKTIVDFVTSRITRLYPAYWICVTLTALAVAFWGSGPMTVTLPYYLTNLTMAQFLVGSPHVDGVYWSLVIELRFYFLVFVCLSIGVRDRWLLVLAGWLAAVVANTLLPDLDHTIVDFFLIPTWASYFIAGSVFYVVRRDGWTVARAVVIGAACLLSIDLSIKEAVEIALYYRAEIDAAIVAALVLSFHLLFVLIVSDRLTWLNHPSFAAIGALTYPLYLIHQNIGYILIENLAPIIDKHLLLIAVIAAMTALSWAIHRLGERPLAAWTKATIGSVLQNFSRRRIGQIVSGIGR